jgi:hypothetical protein
LVVLAALLVGALLFLATGGAQGTPTRKPVYIGLESELYKSINTGGPLYFAHPFGGTGFWLAVDKGALVALVARRPGTTDCTAKWRLPRHAYVDCHGTSLSSEQLDRYSLTYPKVGPEQGGVVVDFRRVAPAPRPLPAAG